MHKKKSVTWMHSNVGLNSLHTEVHGVVCVLCSGRLAVAPQNFSRILSIYSASHVMSVKFNTHQRQKKREHSTLYGQNEVYFNLNLNLVACLLIKSSSIGFGFTHMKPFTIKSNIIKKLKGDELRPISLCSNTLCKQWAQAQTHQHRTQEYVERNAYSNEIKREETNSSIRMMKEKCLGEWCRTFNSSET